MPHFDEEMYEAETRTTYLNSAFMEVAAMTREHLGAKHNIALAFMQERGVTGSEKFMEAFSRQIQGDDRVWVSFGAQAQASHNGLPHEVLGKLVQTFETEMPDRLQRLITRRIETGDLDIGDAEPEEFIRELFVAMDVTPADNEQGKVQSTALHEEQFAPFFPDA